MKSVDTIKSMNYRKEIDGLRGISVLAVVFYHANFQINETKILSGGYLGVDIFFVISGYLITTLILQEYYLNKFSFINFYKRRARRILPCLFFVTLLTLPFAFYLFLPSSLDDLSNSIYYLFFFISNIYFFYTSTQYAFDGFDTNPMLHTWSLSVEEQFYILFPILLVLLLKYFTRKKIFLIIILVISLIYSHLISKNISLGFFYLLQTRIWELLSGALLAMMILENNKLILKIKNNIFYFHFGFFSILLSFFLFDENSHHPSFFTLFPVIGTCLVLIYDQKEASIFLKKNFLIKIGLISYSFYLWHFPIFIYAKFYFYDELNNLIKIFLILFSLILSFFSYKYIELPFRSKKLLFKKVLFFVITCQILILAICYILFQTESKKFSQNKKNFKIENFYLDNGFYLKNDHYKFRTEYSPKKFELKNNQENILVVGNSFGEDLFKTLNINNNFQKVQLELISPLTRSQNEAYEIKCLIKLIDEKNTNCGPKDYTSNIIEQFNDATTVMLSTLWTRDEISLLNKLIILLKNKNKKIIIVGQSLLLRNDFSAYNFTEIDYFVYLKQRMPDLRELTVLEKKLFNSIFQEEKINKRINNEVLKINSELKKIAIDNQVKFLNPLDYQCDRVMEKCFLLDDSGYKLYFDYGHITANAAIFFNKKINQIDWFNY